MSLCVLCGQQDPDDGNLCSAHMSANESWASGNRIMCDFLHRGIVPSRIAPDDRTDLVVAVGLEATESALELVADL